MEKIYKDKTPSEKARYKSPARKLKNNCAKCGKRCVGKRCSKCYNHKEFQKEYWTKERRDKASWNTRQAWVDGKIKCWWYEATDEQKENWKRAVKISRELRKQKGLLIGRKPRKKKITAFSRWKIINER